MVLFATFFLFAAAPQSAEEEREDSYVETDGSGLTIQSVPSGATVYIDGVRRGETPLVLENLAPGSYHLVLVKDGYEKRSVRLTLTEGKHLDLTLVLVKATGRLIITVERAPEAPGPEKLPLDAEISVDGIAVPFSSYLSLPVGLHRVRVEAFGWESVEKTVMIYQDLTQILEVSLQPARFRISGFRTERSRFNPHNPGMLGATDIRFSVSAAGTGIITILDSRNKPVYQYQFPPFTERNQRLTWRGIDNTGAILGDGPYTLVLTATSLPIDNSEPIGLTERLSIIIDSSLVIRPWSITSGLAGLLYVPLAETLGSGSFQMDARLAAGLPYGSDSAFTSVPFSFGLRISPADAWELGLSGEFDTSREPDANQFSLALRRRLSGSSPKASLSMALDLSYTLAEVSALDDPLVISWSGSQGGIRLGLPIFVPLGAGIGFGLGPGVVWPMDSSGSGTAVIPTLELGAGLAAMGTTLTGGLSAKVIWQETPGTSIIWEPGPAFAAGEFHWFPRPSVFVFHLSGGLWYYREKAGTFGSIGLGIIH